MGTVGYLLDTHTLLWAVQKDVKLSNSARAKIEDIDTPLFVSAASAYEIMNKYRLGKLPDYAYIAENYFDVLHTLGADELPINTRHAHYAGKFEWTHRDPFDRLLAAQAFTDNLTLITNDPVFRELSWITVLW
jgi:PIN domain nuclease of toxin-antitoxin system